jgi:hypothetical protein
MCDFARWLVWGWVSPGPILDDEWLAEVLGELLAHQARVCRPVTR